MFEVVSVLSDECLPQLPLLHLLLLHGLHNRVLSVLRQPSLVSQRLWIGNSRQTLKISKAPEDFEWFIKMGQNVISNQSIARGTSVS